MNGFRFGRRALACLPALTLLLGAALARPQQVSAHAELAQSDPPAQSVLTRAPERIELVFTEPVEPRSLEVRVLDRNRQPVDRNDARFAPGMQDTIIVSVGDVQPGLYTISWKVTSTDDGHTTRGLVPFSVGDPGAVPEPLSAADIGRATSEESGVQSGPVGAVARWLTLLSMLALGGLFVTGPLLLRPARSLLDGMRGSKAEVAVIEGAPQQVATIALARVTRIAWGALGLFAAGSLLLLLVDAAAFGGTSLTGALDGSIGDWLTTRRGVLWTVRAALGVTLAVALVAAFRAGPADDLPRPARWWLPAAIVAAMLLATSMGSHSAALASWTGVATAVDWIHQLAVATWVGGLIFLALVLLPALRPLAGPARTRLLAALVPRFSTIAMASVGVILLTGLYQTWRLLDGFDALRELAWGRALVVKLLAVALLVALGAVNLLLVRPRLTAYARSTDRATREKAAALRLTFRRVVATEAALGVAIVLVVGFLTGTTPSQAVGGLPDGPFRPFILDVAAEDLSGRLVLSPGRIGNNRFDLSVRRVSGEPLPEGTQAVLRIFTLDQDTGTSEARMESLGGGRFTAAGPYLSTVGLWEVAAVVRRPGADDATLPFRFSLTELTGQPQAEERRPAAPLARGREIYQQSCIQCHGDGGRGDGPLAAALRPPPLDLTVHVPLHPDQGIYNFIANGVPRTSMQAWSGQFSPEEIQAIVNYLRELARQGR